MAEMQKDNLQIRNSTIDFLVFTKDAQENGIEVRVQNGDVWLTQKAIGQLFDVDRSVVTKHLKNVFDSGELSEDSTCANFAQVADNGKPININSTPCLPLLPWVIVSTPAGPPNSGNGQPRCWTPLPSRDMSWTRAA